MGRSPSVALHRGDIFVVNFDPTIGAEIKKMRPALILQNDIANRYSAVTIVAAMSSFNGGKTYPTEVVIEAGAGGVERRSTVLLNQIRTIDKQRLVKKLGALPRGVMEHVDAALAISLGLMEL